MKTAIIWNEMGEIRYAVLDGDYRRLHSIYINDSHYYNQHDENDLYQLFIDKNGEEKDNFVHISTFADAIRDGAFLIECGFVP